MKKLFNEFKTFITRGNVIDLAVGVIIGGAFTAIVTALTSNILQPLINWVIYLFSGSNGSLDGVYTFLVGNASDIANAIYIDWGALISAVINFLLIAVVLFFIVKTINRIDAERNKLKSNLRKGIIKKEDRKKLKRLGIKLTDTEKVKAYFEEKVRKENEEAELVKIKAEEEAKRLALENPTEIDLLKSIKELLEKK